MFVAVDEDSPSLRPETSHISSGDWRVLARYWYPVAVDALVKDAPLTGKLLYVSPEYDTGIESDIAEWFEKYYSIRFRNYPVPLDYLHDREEVACAGL